ncbi:MAG: hypothetical protein KatS3mg096_637 [Candidatus Parcubacteria bacterium]|nr:MAG: hypothetical protein KatS3mg096_637 [Candidatus Parcubacteria bacterium]
MIQFFSNNRKGYKKFEKGGIPSTDTPLIEIFNKPNLIFNYLYLTGFENLEGIDKNKLVALVYELKLSEDDLRKLKVIDEYTVYHDGKEYVILEEGEEYDEYVKDRIEEIIEEAYNQIPEHLQYYFDEEKYKQDILIETSNGATLISDTYNEIKIGDKDYYVFYV